MNYLLYVEHAAENLQFYLWFRDYIKRFTDLPPQEKALSPPWLPEKSEFLASKQRGLSIKPPRKIAIPDIFKGTDLESPPIQEKSLDPFEEDHASSKLGEDDRTTLRGTLRSGVQQTAAMAYEEADVMLQPCMKCIDLMQYISVLT